MKLAVESDQPIAQTARNLRVNENTLHTWIGKYHQAERQEQQVQDEHLYEELKRLRKENARLKEQRAILKKAAAFRATAAVKYAWMHQQHAEFRVSRLGRLLGVSRSGYYKWRRRPPSAQVKAEQHLQHQVQHCFAQGRGTYGTRRIKPFVATEGLVLSRRRIGRLLVQAGRRCKMRRTFKASTAAGHAQHGIQPSMSRQGNCWDNAVAESFFHTLKTELIYRENFDTHEQAQTAVFEYIKGFYNRQRCHSATGYLASLAHEQALKVNGAFCPEKC